MTTHLSDTAWKILPERAIVTEFCQFTLDSLRAHIAILRGDGTIIAVNAAWNEFANRNGLHGSAGGIGANYLHICQRATGPCSEDAHLVADGIQDVSSGRAPYFELDYPCHSPTEQRWFHVRVTRFGIDSQTHIVVAHDDITERKLAEIALGEANQHLVAQAMTDGLTGVANRRRFDQTLAGEWERHTRSGSPLSLLLMDVDQFKKFNDVQGHLAGDDCLREVAQTIQSAVSRPGDLVARYGGEEFAAILAETDRAGSLAVAGAVAERVRFRHLSHPASDVGPIVTLSIGCATMVPGRGKSEAEIVGLADQALYQAKAEGRNRVIHSR